MSLTGVFSERNEPNSADGRMKDCTQQSYRMVLAYGGLNLVNTAAAREQFEDAEGLPELDTADGVQEGREQETGLLDYRPCDTAASRLHGVTAHKASEIDLPLLLERPRTALALSGQGAGLPSGYIGPHSVCFVTRSDGDLDVYDPLAEWGSAPTVTPRAAILAWHRRLPNDIRYATKDEFKEEIMFTPAAPPATCDFVGGQTYHDLRSQQDAGVQSAAKGVVLLGGDTRPSLGAAYPPTPFVLIVHPSAGIVWTAKSSIANVVTPTASAIKNIVGTVNADGSVTFHV